MSAAGDGTRRPGARGLQPRAGPDQAGADTRTKAGTGTAGGTQTPLDGGVREAVLGDETRREVDVQGVHDGSFRVMEVTMPGYDHAIN